MDRKKGKERGNEGKKEEGARRWEGEEGEQSSPVKKGIKA